MGKKEIGCCGAYCGTCPVIREKACKGCKMGYNTGERDISKAKCKIKVCCVGKNHISCADCAKHGKCAVLLEFYGKNGYKYKKYREAIEYIAANGYEKFLDIADKWKIQYGSYKNK